MPEKDTRRFDAVLSTDAGRGGVSQLVGVGMPLFGLQVEFLMLAPLALSQLALGIWLVARIQRG